MRGSLREFPRQISVGDRSVRWIEGEVVDWVKQTIDMLHLNAGLINQPSIPIGIKVKTALIS